MSRAGVMTLVAAGCTSAGDAWPTASDNPALLRDTSGAELGWQCGEAGCRVVATAQSPPPPTCDDGEAPGYSVIAGQFASVAGVCAQDGFWSSLGDWQRPVACTVDADCPQLFEHASPRWFECRNHLCQSTDRIGYPPASIHRDEARLLCFATFPRSETTEPASPASIAVMLWVDEACQDPEACILPLPGDCVQP